MRTWKALLVKDVQSCADSSYGGKWIIGRKKFLKRQETILLFSFPYTTIIPSYKACGNSLKLLLVIYHVLVFLRSTLTNGVNDYVYVISIFFISKDTFPHDFMTQRFLNIVHQQWTWHTYENISYWFSHRHFGLNVTYDYMRERKHVIFVFV